MRILIERCSNPSDWYNDQIGSIFNVSDIRVGGGYQLRGNTNLWIDQNDGVALVEKTHTASVVLQTYSYNSLIQKYFEPFDPARAMKGEKVISPGSTSEFKYIGVSLMGATYPYLFEWDNKLSDPTVIYVNEQGEVSQIRTFHGQKLYMAPKESETITHYINIYRCKSGGYITGINHEYYDQAVRYGEADEDGDYLKTVPITFTI